MGAKIGLETLREVYRLRVFENRVLRKVLRSKWDEVTGDCWKVHSVELKDFSFSRSIIWVIKTR
jgi:hypothetical protein